MGMYECIDMHACICVFVHVFVYVGMYRCKCAVCPCMYVHVWMLVYVCMCVSSLHVLTAFSLYHMYVENVQYPFSYEIEPAIPSLQLKLTQRLLRAQKVAESLADRERQSDCTQSTHFTLIPR